MEETKETITTLETILKGQDLKQFNSAVKTWHTMPKSALAMLNKMSAIGQALNTLYDKGIEKGLKKDAITVIARKHFEGLNRRERSEYRKLASNIVEIKLFVEFSGMKSANPTYLVNAWVKAVKEDFEACEAIEVELQGGLDVQGNLMNKGEGENVKGVATETGSKDITVIADPTIKTGLKVKSEPLTGDELTVQLGFIVNQIKTMFNKGKLSADNLTIIEQHLTSALQHINDVDIEVKLSNVG